MTAIEMKALPVDPNSPGSIGCAMAVRCCKSDDAAACLLVHAVAAAELVKAEREKEGGHADAQLGVYAAKLAASRKKLKKVRPEPCSVALSLVIKVDLFDSSQHVLWSYYVPKGFDAHALRPRQVEMLAIQTRNRVENIERMHEQLLVSEKNFKGELREFSAVCLVSASHVLALSGVRPSGQDR